MTGKVPKITYKRLANHRKKCYTVKERQDRRNMLLDKRQKRGACKSRLRVGCVT